jgi:oligopeptide/dipeptide ABC transporter ATP-binding protein
VTKSEVSTGPAATTSNDVSGSASPLLKVKDLHVTFHTRRGEMQAVNGVSFEVATSGMLGIAGESGSGKSATVRAVIGLHPPLNTTVSGSVQFDGNELLSLKEHQWRKIRGRQIAMIYQDTMRSLNPIMTVGSQISEALRLNCHLNREQAKTRAIELLDLVRIPVAARRYSNYPHQLSGGMRQRVMIAMALSCEPKLLIADEPTTALDVTTQAQIMNLIADLQKDLGMSVIFITHDLYLAATYTDNVAVMYAGKLVERASSDDLLKHQAMPYTEALVAAMPGFDMPPHTRLVAVEGRPPDPYALPPGCNFNPRCKYADDQCRSEAPPLTEGEPEHWCACWHPLVQDRGHVNSSN